MNLFLLLSAIVILACVLCNRLSSKLGVPTLLAFILLGMFFGCDGVVRSLLRTILWPRISVPWP